MFYGNLIRKPGRFCSRVFLWFLDALSHLLRAKKILNSHVKFEKRVDLLPQTW